jgi:hypothetical protein
VRAIPSEGLTLLLRSVRAQELCPPGSRVLFPEGSLRTVPARVASAEPLPPWREALGLTFEAGLDARSLVGLEVVAQLATRPEELTLLAWRARDGRSGEITGSVREQRGRRIARYDLAGSLDWLLSGEVRSLELPRGRRAIEEAFFLEQADPAGASVPSREEGDDWLVGPIGESGVEGVVTFLSSADFACESRVLVAEGDLWRARDVGTFFARADAARGAVLWGLELRSGEDVVARCEGTRATLP